MCRDDSRVCMCRIGCTGASMTLPPSFATLSRFNPRFAWTSSNRRWAWSKNPGGQNCVQAPPGSITKSATSCEQIPCCGPTQFRWNPRRKSLAGLESRWTPKTSPETGCSTLKHGVNFAHPFPFDPLVQATVGSRRVSVRALVTPGLWLVIKPVDLFPF